MSLGQGSEATKVILCLYAKQPLHTGVRKGWHYHIILLVCMCNVRHLLREL